jgi:hypothetical protein
MPAQPESSKEADSNIYRDNIYNIVYYIYVPLGAPIRHEMNKIWLSKPRTELELGV